MIQTRKIEPVRADGDITVDCGCRKPKRHSDCMYCGSGFGDSICGVCKEAGIDGRLIRGTGRRTCAQHKRGR
jgi:hypothetical protein